LSLKNLFVNTSLIEENNVKLKTKPLDDSNGLVSYVIEESLKIKDIDRLQKVVDGGLIHSTLLPKLCVRQVALHRYTNIKVEESAHTVNDSLVWYLGRSLEEYNRNNLIECVGKESIIGKWTCLCKDDPKELIHNYNGDWIGDDTTCKKCGHKPIKYHELPLLLTDYNVVCNPDLSYFNESMKIVNWELKSIKEHSNGGQLSGFKELEDATNDNKKQAIMQNLIMKKLNFNAADYVLINYTSKAHTGFKLLPFKEYKIKINEHSEIVSYNEELLKKGLIIKSMDKNGMVSDEYKTKDNFPEGVHDKTICGKCLMFSICNNLKDIYNND
jgi:hypothetical protein